MGTLTDLQDAFAWLEQHAPEPSPPPRPSDASWAQVSGSIITRGRPHSRRGLAGLLVLAAAVVAIAATLVPVLVHHDQSARPSPNTAPALPSNKPTVTPSNTRSVMPSSYIAHGPSPSGNGSIAVYDARTGTLLRTLGTVADPYPQNGFQVSADHKTLYYVRLNEPAQKIEIVSVPVSGGPTTVLADGTRPTPSPDGQKLAYVADGHANEIAVMTLATKTVEFLRLPAQAAGQTLADLAWTAGSTKLFATAITPIQSRDCPPAAACPDPPPGPSSAYLIDINVQSWAELAKPTGFTWVGVQLVPGAALANGVLVTAGLDRPTGSATISTIDLTSGQIVATHVIPSGQSIAVSDVSGTFILLSGPSGTISWQPSSGRTVQLGAAGHSGPSELTW